jgi:hypothetical protein
MMTPRSRGSPSTGWRAGSGPARDRICGRTEGPVAWMCRRTRTGAAKSSGSADTNARSASTPPADAATATRWRARPPVPEAAPPARE